MHKLKGASEMLRQDCLDDHDLRGRPSLITEPQRHRRIEPLVLRMSPQFQIEKIHSQRVALNDIP